MWTSRMAEALWRDYLYMRRHDPNGASQDFYGVERRKRLALALGYLARRTLRPWSFHAA